MSPLAVLLRFMLCLALILNGSVPAVHAAMIAAPAHAVPAMDHVPAMAVDVADDAEAGGCHDAAPADHAPPSQSPAPADDGDCCDDHGDCRSSCAQHCAVSIPGVPRLHLTLAPAAGPLPITVATQPDPHLRDRIRPPIA
ncbi:CopL family metal-binding regulatory protein [Lysobacter brunescens]|uniref:CopL family metal-binding regulatory protein n=1 Tax=Lysobacter brunescens TaxID=262323 RepID=A0ABW2YFM1_9GAMM